MSYPDWLAMLCPLWLSGYDAALYALRYYKKRRSPNALNSLIICL
ncbi:hypothetical protein [Spirosoma telluris]